MRTNSKSLRGLRKKANSLARLLFVFLLFVSLSASAVYTYTRVATPKRALAATSSNLNYQARLYDNPGNVVPDGYYNIEFKLYSASSGGSALWTETYYDSNGATAGNDNRVRVVNGYLSVNLASITPFPALNWDQDMWLTMNVGGATQTASPTWDGEMSPRIKLTAVPYAFQAKQAESLSALQGANAGTLGFDTLTGNRDILLPDESGTVCLQGSTNCGFASATGSSAYIQNTTTLQAGANFHIQAVDSGVSGTIGGIIRGASGGQTVDLLQLQGSTGTVLAGVSSAGQIFTGATQAISNTQLSVVSGASTRVTILARAAASQTVDILQIQNSSSTILAAFNASGQLVFGPSGSQDTNLYRPQANILKTDDAFHAVGSIIANLGSSSEIQLTSGTGSRPEIKFGSALDTSLYRSAADTLRTDDNFSAGTISSDSTVGAGSLVYGNTGLYANTNSAGGGYFGKVALIGTGGVSSGDVVVFENDGGNGRAIKTTIPRNPNVYGIATGTFGSGTSIVFAIGGNYTVNADTAAINIGDQLVTSSTAGRVTVDNNATTGILGRATTAKVGGSNGTVGVAINIVGGATNPYFRSSDFRIQDATGATDLFRVDGSTQQLAVGPAAVPANGVLTVGTDTTTASGGIYFGTDTNLYRGAAGQLNTDGGIIAAGYFTAGLNITAYNGTGSQVIIGAQGPGSQAGIKFGSSGDTNLYRSAANTLKTDDAFFVNTNSTVALKVEQTGVNNNTLVVDTTNGRVGIGKVPTNGTLDVQGIAQATQFYSTTGLVMTTNGTSTIDKQATVGSTGANQYDVLVLDTTTTGTDKVVTTTTARDPRVYGIAKLTVGAGSTGEYAAISGTYVVNANNGAINVGDQLVTSTTAGAVMADNNATTGIIGYALSSKTAGSAGTVNISIRPVNGQSSPYYRTTDFRIQDATGSTDLFRVDGSGQKLAVGPGAVPANGVLTIGTDTTTASGGLFFGTDTGLYRSAANTLRTDDSLNIFGAGGASTSLVIQAAVGQTGYLQEWKNSAGSTMASVNNQGNFIGKTFLARDGTLTTNGFSSQTGTDTNPRFQVQIGGQIGWSDGTNPIDTNLYRSAADLLKTDDAFFINTNSTTALKVEQSGVNNNVLVVDTTNARVGISGAPSTSTAKLFVDGGTDVTLGAGTGYLQLGATNTNNLVLDDNEIQARINGAGTTLSLQHEGANLDIGHVTNRTTTTSVYGEVDIYRTAAQLTNSALKVMNASESEARFRVVANGNLEWGDGSVAPDTNLYRSAANTLQTDDELSININGGKNTLSLTSQGVDTGITIGSDTNLYRSAADTLKTDDKLVVGGNLNVDGTGTSYIMGPLGLGTANPQAASALTIANNAWITAVDAAGTGFINMFSVNTNNEIQVGAALNIDSGIILPTSGGQITFADMPIDASTAAGTAESYTFRVGSTNALTVYGQSDAAGGAQNVRVAIGSSISPQYTLDVGGDINTTGVYRINGTQICSSSGCTPAAGSGNYIQNGTGTQASANFNIQSAAVGSISAVIKALGSQTADLLQFQSSGGNALTAIDVSGKLQFADGAGGAYDTNLYRSGADSLKTDDAFFINNNASTALKVEYTAGTASQQNVLVVNTTDGRVGVGNAPSGAGARLTVTGTNTSGSSYALSAGGSSGTGLVVSNAGTVAIGANAVGNTALYINKALGTQSNTYGNWNQITGTTNGAGGWAMGQNNAYTFTATGTNSNVRAVNTNMDVTGGADGNTDVWGTSTFVNLQGANPVLEVVAGSFQATNLATAGTTPYFDGVLGAVNVAAAGSVTEARVFDAAVGLSSSGNISDYRAFYSRPVYGSSTGRITTAYGLYLDGLAGTYVTGTSYGIYQAGANDINQFAGATEIDNTLLVKSGSATALLIQNASSQSLLTVDASNTRVTLDDGQAAQANLFVVDSSSAAPTGVNGGIYYDTGLNKFRCYQNGGWVDCVGAGAGGGTSTLQDAYNNTAAATPEIILDSTRGALTVRDNSTPITGNLLEVQDNGGTTTYLAVDTSGIGVTGSIKLAGSTTFPGSPTEGQIYYRTDTDQLYVYTGSKWQADRTTATKIVAMGSTTGCTGSSPVASSNPEAADFVSTSCTSAQTTINSAISALPSGGGTVYLMEGTYIVDGSISLPSNVTLAGAGPSTVIKLKDSINAAFETVENSDQTTGNTRIAIRDLRLDGNRTNNTSGNQHGIYMQKVGSGTGSSATAGVRIENVWVENFRNNGFYLRESLNGTLSGNTAINNGFDGFNIGINASGSDNNTLTGNLSQGNGSDGFEVTGSDQNNLSGNTAQGNGDVGFYVSAQSSYNNLTGNLSQGNASYGMRAWNASNYNTFAGNTVMGNSGFGIALSISSNGNTITGNNLRDNVLDGINLNSVTDSLVSDNLVQNSGGSGASMGIRVSGSTNSYISGNRITDTAGTGYAIDINNTSTGTNLSGNIFSGTGASTINDTGVNTIWSNQLDTSGNLINRNNGGLSVGTKTVSTTLTVKGAISNSQLATPGAPTLSIVGTAGTTSRTYQITALDGLGETLPSTSTTTTTSNATLSISNYVNVTWSPVDGAVQYKIYRCTGASCTPALLTTVAGNVASYNDTSNGSPSGALPTANTTGNTSLVGTLKVQTATNSTTAFQIQNAAGTSNLLIADTVNNRISIGKASADTWTQLDVAGGIQTDNNFFLSQAGRGIQWGDSTTSLLGDASTDVITIKLNAADTIKFNASGKTTLNLLSTGTDTGITIGGDTNLYRTAADTLKTDDALTIQGQLTVNSTSIFAGNQTNSGNILANANATATTGTTEATARSNVTTVTLTAAGSFADNDVIFINNAGQDYFTRIVSGGGTTTLTVSPAVSYDASASVTKYNISNIGARNTNYTSINDRFFQGYFLGGIVAGAGSTHYSDGNILFQGDTNLYRSGANSLKTDGGFYSGGSLFAADGLTSKVSIGSQGPSGEAGIKFGSAGDTSLYRSGADQLQTDDRLIVNNRLSVWNRQDIVATNTQAFLIQNGTSQSLLTADTSGMLVTIDNGTDATVSGGGYLQLGGSAGQNIVADNNEIMARNNGAAATLFLQNDGGNVQIGSSAVLQFGADTNLYRTAADVLRTDDRFDINRSASTDSALTVRVSAEASARFNITAGGGIEWGAGGAASRDTFLYRSGVDTLETSSLFSINQSAGADWALQTWISGGAASPFAVQTNGTLNWGDGTSVQDTNLYRSAANILKTDDSINVNERIFLNGTSSQLQWGDGSGTFDISMARAAAGLMTLTGGQLDVVRTNATDAILSGDFSGASTSSLRVYANGKIEWGDGGVGGRDTNLYRNSADFLKTDDSFIAQGNLYTNSTIQLQGGAGSKAALNITSTTADTGITIGGDTNLYRSAANTLKTDDQLLVQNDSTVALRIQDSSANNILWVDTTNKRVNVQGDGGLFVRDMSTGTVNGRINSDGSAAFNGNISVTRAGAANNALVTYVSGDTNPRFQIDADGEIHWGAGGVSALDTNLYRELGNALKTDGYLTSLGFYVDNAPAASNNALSVKLNADSGYRLRVKGDGTIVWGDGAGAEDTKLYRTAANQLRADTNILQLWGTGTNGAGAKLLFGDTFSTNNVFVGEEGTTDTDVLQLHGVGGVKITTDGVTPHVAAQFFNDGSVTFENEFDSIAGFTVLGGNSKAMLNVNTLDESVIINGFSGLGDNELQNPSFEFNGDTGVGGNGWYMDTGVTIGSNNARSGLRSMQVAANSTILGAGAGKTFSVTPGEEIYLEGYVKTAAGTNGSGGFFIAFNDQNHTNTTFVNSDWTNPGTTYTLKTIRTTVPAGKYWMSINTTVRADSTTGTWYFDDMYLHRVTQQAPLVVKSSSNSATAFQIQTSSGAAVLTVDTTTSTISLGSGAGMNFNNQDAYALNSLLFNDGGANEGISWQDQNWKIDTSPLDRSNNTGNLNLYGTTGNIAFWRPTLWVQDATNYTTATAGANGSLTFTSSGSGGFTFKPGTDTGSTTTFQVQDAAGTSLILVNASTHSLRFGDATNNMTFTAGTYEPVLNGTAQHSKSVILAAEYPGSVLDAANDSSCTAANNGTMTSGLATAVASFGNTNVNFYNWISSQATNQCFDVVVQVPVPGDFASWNGAPTIQVWTDNTANVVLAADVIDTAGAQVGTAYGNTLTPTANSTWQSKSFGSLTGTYTNNQYFTIRVRMTAKNGSKVRIGNINLNYKAKY